MIPKPLNEIEWSDIEALRDSGREEDDTIEYKASFSGGADFLTFTDSQRVKAVAGIASEALAFLNGRGGDIVIGVREAKNDHPKIEEITPVANVLVTVDRLAQSLAAVIEPTQSILGVRAIRPSDDASDGVIVVRAPSSLRAPHRFTGNKECYIRRGRESVPMPMDEVQDVTLNRATRRADRAEALAQLFEALNLDRIGGRSLVRPRFHFRCAYVPHQTSQISLDRKTLEEFLGSDRPVFLGDRTMTNDVAFRGLYSNWKTILRGRRVANVDEYEGRQSYSGKEIYESGVMVSDFADNFVDERKGRSVFGPYLAWLIGYLANTLSSMEVTLKQHPNVADGVLQLACLLPEQAHLILGDPLWTQPHPLPAGVIRLPEFEVIGGRNLDEIFQQLQVDICALAEVDCGQAYSLVES